MCTIHGVRWLISGVMCVRQMNIMLYSRFSRKYLNIFNAMISNLSLEFKNCAHAYFFSNWWICEFMFWMIWLLAFGMLGHVCVFENFKWLFNVYMSVRNEFECLWPKLRLKTENSFYIQNSEQTRCLFPLLGVKIEYEFP